MCKTDRSRTVCLLCVATTMVAGAGLFAQSFYAGLRGRVTDSAGASVAGAKVEIVNSSTGARLRTAANEDGEYVFPTINPGTYDLSVESTGMKKYERKGIILETKLFLTVDIQMEVGSLSERVQVVAAEAPLETVIPTAGQLLDHQKLLDLPNIGRNPFIVLARLSPNAIPTGTPRFTRMQDQSGTSTIAVAGSPKQSNNFLLDGIPVTDASNRTIIIPSLEAVEETKIQTNTYDAEMGRTGGGTFNTYLKSGTNTYHGSGFGNLREPEWAANDFFGNRNRIPRPDASYKAFGGSFGGPVSIPKVYNGKNKTFFWLTHEGYRQLDPFAGEFSVPTAAERAGDFSTSLNRAGSLQVIYDPLTTRIVGSSVVRDPFANNQIPADRLDTVGRAVARDFPLPDRSTAYYGAVNVAVSTIVPNRGDQSTGKLDHDFTSKWRASLSYLRCKTMEPNARPFSTVATPQQKVLYRKSDLTQFNNTITLNPTTVATVRYGFNRFPNDYRSFSDGYDPGQLGFPSSFLKDIQARKYPGFAFQTFGSLGPADTSWITYSSKNLSGNISKFVGRHDLKAGADFRQLDLDFISYGYSSGFFAFDDTFTRSDYTRFDSRTGSDLASLLLGYPSSGTAQTSTKFFQFIRYYAGYFQDNWRVKPKLTLNLGLRYEWETGLAERNNALIVGFDRNAVNPIAQRVSGITPKGTLLYAGLNGNSNSCCDPNKNKFSPRIGVAFNINDRTVIRGGYGLYWAPLLHGGTSSGFNPIGYTQATDVIGTNDGGRTPAAKLSDPFPNGLLKPIGNALGPAVGIGQNISFIDQFSRSPYVHQFSFDLQRVIPAGITVTAGYYGSRANHISLGSTQSQNINQLNPNYLSMGSALLSSVDNPFFGKGGTGVIGAARIIQAQLLFTYPEFGQVSMQFSDYNRARYDSLVLKAQKRFLHGLTFLTSWTWSKSLDGGYASPQNVYDLGAEYSPSANDATHRFTSAVIYDLPFGKGRRFMNHNRLLDFAAGGWQLNVINVYQSGFPLGITQSNLNGNIGATVQRPNATGVAPMPQTRSVDFWINPAAFSQAPAFTFGNVARTINERGPGEATSDVSLFKTFNIVERLSAQFRVEALNAFNTPYFSTPNTTFGTPTFGKVTSQYNYPRLIQLGIRVIF